MNERINELLMLLNFWSVCNLNHCFCVSCYLKSIFLLRHCSFKSSIHFIVYRQSEYRYITFSVSNLKIYACYVIMMSYQYTIFCPRSFKLYYTVCQRLIKIPPKIAEIFEWNSDFNAWGGYWWFWWFVYMSWISRLWQSLVFLLLFLFYAQMIYYLKPYQKLHFHLYINSSNFLMSWNNCHYIPLNYASAQLYQDLLNYLFMCC